MKRILLLGLAVIFFQQGGNAQKIDTLLLYAGGPNYVLKKAYVSGAPLPPCSDYQNDGFYNNSVGRNVYNSGKTAIGDITYLPPEPSTTTFFLNSTVAIKKSATVGLDTILAQQVSTGEVEIWKQYRQYKVYALITGKIIDLAQGRSWSQILCTPPSGTDSVIQKYRVIIENSPNLVNKEYKLCPNSPILNLYTNVDNKKGTFWWAPHRTTRSEAKPVPNGLFDPSKYAQGKYDIYYERSYANDPSNSKNLYFTIDVATLGLTLRATPDTIQQGEHTSFQSSFTLLAGDQIASYEWDFGDKTPISKSNNPFHYYIDTGSMIITAKLTSKLGCSQSLMRRLVYVKPSKINVKTEANGPFSFSYEEQNTENDFRLYPNPVKSSFHFGAYVPLQYASLSLRRLLDGEKILTLDYPLLDKVEINMESYPAGLYIVELKSASGDEKHFKLIKE